MFFEELNLFSCLIRGFSQSSRNVLREILKRIPTQKHKTPGTINAKRQLQNPVKAPARIGANTNPKLPNTPLNPSAVPVLEVLETSHDIPTG